MKKIGLLVVFIGAILLSGIGFIYYTEGAEAFSIKTLKIHKGKQVNATDVKAVMVESRTVDVRVLPSTSSDNEVTVELNGEVSNKMKDAFRLDVSKQNGTLTIQVERIMLPSFVVFAINKGMQLTVNLPTKLYEEIQLNSASGDILIRDISAKAINATSKSGDLVGMRLQSKESSLQAYSGDITAKNISSDKLSLKTASGDISGEDLADYTNLFLTSTSGDVNLDTTEKNLTLDFNAGSGEGTILVPGFHFTEKAEDRIIGQLGKGKEHNITVRTNSGDFTLGR